MNDRALPPHVEQTVRAVEQLHVEHHDSATPVERMLERVKSRLSHPACLGVVTLLVVLWVAASLLLQNAAWDPPPFLYLELILTIIAVYIAILILATQRRADKLAGHREQLILQSAYVSDQKAAKIIALLEELRRDSPQVRDRIDPEADQMTESVNLGAISEALRETAPDPSDIRG